MPNLHRNRHAALLGAVALAAFAPCPCPCPCPRPRRRSGRWSGSRTGSIYGRCTADDVTGQEKKFKAKNYLAAAVEPQLAVNPLYPDELLFGVQQDRWSNGGSRGQRGDYSFDGGTTWKPSSTTGVTLCQNGPWQRSSDPWIAFSADGTTAYFSALTVDESANPNALAALSGQTVNTSHDGGKTWAPPSTLIIDNNINILNDKNSVWADRALPKFAYVVWDRLQQFNGSNAGVADEGENSGADAGAAAILFPQGMPARRQRGRPRADEPRARGAGRDRQTGEISAAGERADRVLAHDRSGQHVVRADHLARPRAQRADDREPDRDAAPGTTRELLHRAERQYERPAGAHRLRRIVRPRAALECGKLRPGDRQPAGEDAEPAWRGSARPTCCSRSRSTSRTTLPTWFGKTSGSTGDNEIAFAFSPDNGFEWTAPVRINQTPRNSANPLFQQALIPTVAVAADGTVGITYYDFQQRQGRGQDRSGRLLGGDVQHAHLGRQLPQQRATGRASRG